MHSSLWFATCVAALQPPAARRPVAPPTRLHAVAPESQWQWQDNTIRYASEGPADGTPVLFLHGFGSSLETYRDNAPALAQAGYRCHRLDLLGLGLSEKAPGPYSIGRWRQQAAAFLEANAGGKPAVLVGNSIGSLISLDVAAKRPELVKGLILNNCAGGMNSKFAVTDPAVSEPSRAVGAVFFAVLDFLLGIKPLARSLFDSVRARENVEAVLRQVYTNSERADAVIVDSTLEPAEDPAALDVFVEILSGDPGPRPDEVMDDVKCPIHCLWGRNDQITPLDGTGGRYFQGLAAEGRVSLTLVDAGHVPHDDVPDEANADYLAWLKSI